MALIQALIILSQVWVFLLFFPGLTEKSSLINKQRCLFNKSISRGVFLERNYRDDGISNEFEVKPNMQLWSLCHKEKTTERHIFISHTGVLTMLHVVVLAASAVFV